MSQEMSNNIEAETPEQTRKKYILALAVGLGANEAIARANVDELFVMADQLGEIDCNKGLRELDDDRVAMIRKIGTWFLPEESHTGDYGNGDNRDFALGKRVLELMRAPLDSASFKDLRTDVNGWNLYKGVGRFDEIAGEAF